MLARAPNVAVNDSADPVRWASASLTARSERRGHDVTCGFRLAIEDLPDGVLILGETGAVLAANRLAETIFAFGPGQLVGQPIERLLPQWSPRIHAETWKRSTTLQNRHPDADRPHAGVRSDGVAVPLEIGLTPVVDGRMRYVVVRITGVTDGPRLDAGLVEATSSHASVQRLIADLATRLVTIEPDAIDDTIADSLRQIAEVLQLDRAILWCKGAGDASARASDCSIGHLHSSLHALLEQASVQFIASKLEAGEVASFMRIDELPDQADREAFLRLGLRSAAVVPVTSTGGAGRSALAFGSTTEREWAPAIIEQLRLASGVVGQALARKASLKALRQALDELHRVRERTTADAVSGGTSVTVLREPHLGDGLQAESMCLRREVQERFDAAAIIGQSPAIRRVLTQLQQVAATDSTVLLLGETGTGKELLATHLHALSARRGRTMVRVNCAAIPATLLESELFGRERGAYTGALARQIGRFELAHRSTIFLDEIGDLPADIQVKLLRVLEERQIERLGSPKAIDVDVRIITATHRDLEQRISDEAFREDLFYRLNVFPIQVPALRDRAEDIPLLVWRFVAEFSKAFGKRIDAIPPENMTALQRYSWPGNIRELRNVVERAMIIATRPQLTIALPAASGPAKRCSVTLADVEKEHIRSVLEGTMWRIRGLGGAAERLGLPPTTLETRMAKLGLSRPKRIEARGLQRSKE
jgi:formate hydrogenlyase transcriptional activator